MSGPVLRAEGLGYSVGERALLQGLDFGIAPGAPSFVIGPNGSGKSTLLRLLHGLLAPSQGRVVQAGIGRQAMVFQKPVLLRRSVTQNIAHALSLAGIRDAARIPAALEEVGLPHLAHRPARLLSGGEQQRVALARALALHPDILFLDEPTASLDPAATRAVEAILARAAARGMKIVMTTHDLHQARRLAGEILLLHRGRLIEQAPAETFFQSPASAEAQAFLRGDILE
ncbi:ATP-binding cassette domain-containing protein [Roseococcus sp. SDR]|uniref:ATP-binding cassette domain-containing protein n=1 Tax=Roseococcus sp. SDR TaxID=2835532 RepID=UPI001BCC13DB|nr:ATP-binding cassette domain-containing protein [Roseococcus sp. SDR]MBS7789017.1 ATP-binding cassette domain-containing protein [Roseococcus sp. SDR]MBV1844331.1 ATP-binding cassette domain-containing protein [Roseococcus sp. SDR]